MDEEWLGGYVQRVEYHEDWDEWVSQICSSTCCCDSNGNNCSTTYYDCSYRDYHPEAWYAVTTLHDYSITKERYIKLSNQFGGAPVYQDMKRDYYTDDGDMWYVNWRGQVETVEPVAEVEHYENRPQAALNVFHYDPPDSTDIKRFKLFDYPKVTREHKQSTLLGYSDRSAQQKLHYFNGVYGKKKEIRVFVLVFDNLPREAGIAQENYWAGGNKNEFVVCVGKYGNEIRWAHTFSWTEQKLLGVNVRHRIESLSSFDINKAVDITIEETDGLWERKQFHDFDYLTLSPTPRQTFWIFFWAILIQILVGVFVVNNGFERETKEIRRYY